MKTLQNDYTTPEQSKCLLELGVPRWTANEYRDEKGYRHSLEGILDVELFFQNFPDYSPCWSAGRLMEIIGKTRVVLHGTTFVATPVSDMLLQAFGRLRLLALNNNIDFSKLDE